MHRLSAPSQFGHLTGKESKRAFVGDLELAAIAADDALPGETREYSRHGLQGEPEIVGQFEESGR